MDNQAGPLFGVRLPRGIVTYLNGQPIRTTAQAQEALRVMGKSLGEWGEIEQVNDRPWPGALAGVGEHRPDQPQTAFCGDPYAHSAHEWIRGGSRVDCPGTWMPSAVREQEA